MATGKIVKRSVDALKPGSRDQFLWDDEVRGFGVKATPQGQRVFVFQYRLGGRGSPTRRYTIGKYGVWTPDEAKTEAKRLAGLRDRGIDPIQDREDRRHAATDLSFATVADRFLKDEVAVHWKRSYADIERIFKLHLRKALGSKPLPDIKKRDALKAIDAVSAEQIALRRKLYAVLSRFFTWAVSKDLIQQSPLAGSETPPTPVARDRYLNDQELRLAWLASDELGYPFGPLYRLLIGTGQRREEVSQLDWREMRRESAEWHLPAARAKNGVATTIHLTAAMIAVLDGMADGEKWPRRGLVFTTTGKTPVSGHSRGKSRLDTAMLNLARKEAKANGDDPAHVEIAPWRTHDLRRSVATGLQRLGVRFEVTESVLNHQSGSKAGVAGIYQRHHWTEEKRLAWEAWAKHIEQLVVPADKSNVVQLAAARA